MKMVTSNEVKFIQIYKEDTELYQVLLPEWINYMKEIDDEEQDPNFEEQILNDLQRRIKNQGTRKDMHLELFYYDDVFVGFAHFAIATGALYGLLEPGNGFIMEFYIIPKYRKKGYGKILYNHVENILINDGAKHICLTANHSTGEPFWIAMGFNDTGKIDTDNNLPVYVKNTV